MDVTVTEQRDEDQEGGERRMCGGRTVQTLQIAD